MAYSNINVQFTALAGSFAQTTGAIGASLKNATGAANATSLSFTQLAAASTATTASMSPMVRQITSVSSAILTLADSSVVAKTLVGGFGFWVSASLMQVGNSLKSWSTGTGKAIGVVVDAADELDLKLREVRTIARYSDGQLGELRNGVQDLGIQFSKSSVEIAEGLYQILSASIVPDDDLQGALGFLEEANKLAVAGMATTEESVRALATGTNAWGYSLERASELSNVFFEGVRKGQFWLKDVPAFLGRAAAPAARLGISPGEATGMFAAATIGGQMNRLAAMGVSRLLQSIEEGLGTGTEKARKYDEAFAELGITWDKAAIRGDGTAQNMGRLVDVFTKLSDLADSGDKRKYGRMLNLFAPEQSGRNTLAIITGQKRLLEVFKEVQEAGRTAGSPSGVVDRAFTILEGAPARHRAKIRETWGKIFEDIGQRVEEIIGPLLKMSESFAKGVRWMTEHSKAFRTVIATVLIALKILFTSAAGLILILGRLALLIWHVGTAARMWAEQTIQMGRAAGGATGANNALAASLQRVKAAYAQAGIAGAYTGAPGNTPGANFGAAGAVAPGATAVVPVFNRAKAAAAGFKQAMVELWAVVGALIKQFLALIAIIAVLEVMSRVLRGIWSSFVVPKDVSDEVKTLRKDMADLAASGRLTGEEFERTRAILDKFGGDAGKASERAADALQLMSRAATGSPVSAVEKVRLRYDLKSLGINFPKTKEEAQAAVDAVKKMVQERNKALDEARKLMGGFTTTQVAEDLRRVAGAEAIGATEGESFQITEQAYQDHLSRLKSIAAQGALGKSAEVFSPTLDQNKQTRMYELRAGEDEILATMKEELDVANNEASLASTRLDKATQEGAAQKDITKYRQDYLAALRHASAVHAALVSAQQMFAESEGASTGVKQRHSELLREQLELLKKIADLQKTWAVEEAQQALNLTTAEIAQQEQLLQVLRGKRAAAADIAAVENKILDLGSKQAQQRKALAALETGPGAEAAKIAAATAAFNDQADAMERVAASRKQALQDEIDMAEARAASYDSAAALADAQADGASGGKRRQYAEEARRNRDEAARLRRSTFAARRELANIEQMLAGIGRGDPLAVEKARQQIYQDQLKIATDLLSSEKKREKSGRATSTLLREQESLLREITDQSLTFTNALPTLMNYMLGWRTQQSYMAGGGANREFPFTSFAQGRQRDGSFTGAPMSFGGAWRGALPNTDLSGIEAANQAGMAAAKQVKRDFAAMLSTRGATAGAATGPPMVAVPHKPVPRHAPYSITPPVAAAEPRWGGIGAAVQRFRGILGSTPDAAIPPALRGPLDKFKGVLDRTFESPSGTTVSVNITSPSTDQFARLLQQEVPKTVERCFERASLGASSRSGRV